MPKRRLTNFTRLPPKERKRRKRKKESDNRKAHGSHHPVPRQNVSTDSLASGVVGHSAGVKFLENGAFAVSGRSRLCEEQAWRKRPGKACSKRAVVHRRCW
jgi:hypothetical protein